MAARERRAVLVLPDVGLNEAQVERLKNEFQSNLVSTIKKAGAHADVSVVVVVQIVF